MKRILLGIIAFATFGMVNAQIEIQYEGSGPDISGTIYEVNVSPSSSVPISPKFFVTNNTGADAQWRIVRVRQNVPTEWTDQLCWPPFCFPTSGDMYTTPNTGGTPAPIILDGTNMTSNAEDAELKPQIDPNGVYTNALYMYYILDNNDVYVDSFGIQFNFSVGIEETTPDFSISIAPNPANAYVKVKTNGVEDATVKVVDVLGNIVLKETVMGSSKTINTESFRNGVYFIIVESEGQKPINRKVIVRH